MCPSLNHALHPVEIGLTYVGTSHQKICLDFKNLVNPTKNKDFLTMGPNEPLPKPCLTPGRNRVNSCQSICYQKKCLKGQCSKSRVVGVTYIGRRGKTRPISSCFRNFDFRLRLGEKWKKLKISVKNLQKICVLYRIQLKIRGNFESFLWRKSSKNRKIQFDYRNKVSTTEFSSTFLGKSSTTRIPLRLLFSQESTRKFCSRHFISVTDTLFL